MKKYIFTCPFCKEKNILELDEEKVKQFKEGKSYAQDLFPQLTSEQRELIISGICPKCWNEIFSENDEIIDKGVHALTEENLNQRKN